MAKEAERLLDGTGWLPEPLRLARAPRTEATRRPANGDAEALPDFLADDDDDARRGGEDEQPHVIAAE